MGRLSMSKITEVLRQYYDLKCSYRQIGRSLNISVSTVSDYLARARLANIQWPLPADTSEQALYDALFLPIKEPAPLTRPLPEWPYIHQELRKKAVTLKLLWREYRDANPTGLGYTQFYERYRAYRKTVSPIMHQIYKAGEKTFVDYSGMKMQWIDVMTGELRDAEIFIGALGASQFIFAEATASQQMQDWVQSHIHMWEFFGGVSKVVVPDNLKAGVTKPHRYDPDINKNYQNLGEYYGFAIVPARVREPRDKSKVENAVGCVQRLVIAPLRNKQFKSLGEINQALREGVNKLNNQKLQKMDVSRRELFESIDKPALKPLPKDRYQYADWVKAKINIDYHFAFENHNYSVPHKHVGRAVEVRATGKTVECFYKGERIAIHERSYVRYGFSTTLEHMPANHAEHLTWTPDRITRWAQKIGDKTACFVSRMIQSRAFPEQAFRSCLGLLRLANRFSEERLEKACARALSAGMTRYQEVESILKNGLDSQPMVSNDADHASAEVHENIRGPGYYNNLLEEVKTC
jgi:transposase